MQNTDNQNNNSIIALLEREIFNKHSLKSVAEKIEQKRLSPNNQEDTSSLSCELEDINKALKNVTDAVASGLISDILIAKLKELELQKESIEQRLNNSQVTENIELNLLFKKGLELSRPFFMQF